jgi:Domain of unknown function (DUF4105)
MLRASCVGIILFCCTFPTLAATADYLQELVKQAEIKGLARSDEWRALMHYKDNLLTPGVTSEVDGRGFFNASDGATNPQAELAATLAAFFTAPVAETDELQHPQCVFVARYHWLKQELNFDRQRLPEQPCPRFSRWMESLNPGGATLIFPAAYLNNPASMFGHTLLRIDAKDQDEKTRLLAYTVNYAAGTNERSGLVFAFKGIFGGYRGYFSILPYYLKVNEYSDLESRDIWEYQLNLNEAEINQLLRHVWELRLTYFDYYFFDENCAYHLLSLFDVARPELRLTDQFRFWAIPSETVRYVTQKSGMLKNVVYRPALSTRLIYHLQQMDPKYFDTALDLVDGKLQPTDDVFLRIPEKDRADLLEFAYDYIEYRQAADKKTLNLYSDRAYELLEARSQLPASEAPDNVPVPEIRPDTGHKSGRTSLGVGTLEGDAFVEGEWRPAYHDLLDPTGGYVPGSQIKFFSVRVRDYNDPRDLRLEELMALDIESLSPRNRFFKPHSWKVKAGVVRKYLPDDASLLAGLVNAGTGLDYSLDERNSLYTFLEASLEYSGEYEDNYALGAGPTFGFLSRVTPAWNVHMYTNIMRYALGEQRTDGDLVMEQRLSLDDNDALRLRIGRSREFTVYRTEIMLSWQRYF